MLWHFDASMALAGAAVATFAATAVVIAQPAAATTVNLQCWSLGGGRASCDLFKSSYTDFIVQEWDVNGSPYQYGGSYVDINCPGSYVTVTVTYQDPNTGDWYGELTKTTCY